MKMLAWEQSTTVTKIYNEKNFASSINLALKEYLELKRIRKFGRGNVGRVAKSSWWNMQPERDRQVK
uniref:Uncharacterized protein n=1 Tax=Romanomermis culicivorax TaxID=13658 RepID=A0A915IIG4_ROMCU